MNGTSQVALYVLDEDYQNRSETIQISDANTNAVSSTQNVTNFTGGQYLVYTISGDVNIKVINGSGSLNCVLSGLFFYNDTAAGGGGRAARPPGPTAQSASASNTPPSRPPSTPPHSGDTIDVFSGTYKEQVVIPNGLSTSPSSPPRVRPSMLTPHRQHDLDRRDHRGGRR